MAKSRILDTVHKSAKRLHKAGAMDTLTMRKFDTLCIPTRRKFSSKEVRRIRARVHASQAVFAAFLGVGPTTECSENRLACVNARPDPAYFLRAELAPRRDAQGVEFPHGERVHGARLVKALRALMDSVKNSTLRHCNSPPRSRP